MSKTSQPRRRRMLSFLVLALLAAPLPFGPALADTTPPPGEFAGSGSLAGTERVDEGHFTGSICIEETKSIYALRGIGTYKGRTAGGQDVVYRASIDEANGQTLYADGPIQVEVENTQTYYQGPFGTHGTTDATCAPATVGTPVPAEFRIFGPDRVYRIQGGVQVPCVGHGTFARGEKNNATGINTQVHAEWTLDADCTVVGNEAGIPGTGIAPAGSPHTYSGIHDPCFNGDCANNIRVDYVQYLPFVGLHVSMGGPATAAVGDTLTVVAAVTDDGQALANTPVTFSVAGAGPGAPPAGGAITGADGRATFNFTAATTGDYTVTASATNAATTASGAHVVTFVAPAPPTLRVDGPTRWQTEENVTITATFTNAGRAVPGVVVSFTVAGPAVATPSSGSGITDNDGRAAFTFLADRAGDYRVTASAQVIEARAASHDVHLDINTFRLAAGLQDNAGVGAIAAGVVRPSGDFAYFGGLNTIERIDLATFQRTGARSPWSARAIRPRLSMRPGTTRTSGRGSPPRRSSRWTSGRSSGLGPSRSYGTRLRPTAPKPTSSPPSLIRPANSPTSA
jgi:hypothetical protein